MVPEKTEKDTEAAKPMSDRLSLSTRRESVFIRLGPIPNWSSSGF